MPFHHECLYTLAVPIMPVDFRLAIVKSAMRHISLPRGGDAKVCPAGKPSYPSGRLDAVETLVVVFRQTGDDAGPESTTGHDAWGLSFTARCLQIPQIEFDFFVPLALESSPSCVVLYS